MDERVDASVPSVDASVPSPWIAAGGFAACASREGRVWCWGTRGATVDAEPTEVEELAGARAVVFGLMQACAVLGDGGVACAGSNRAGQLGVDPGALALSERFVVIAGLEDIEEVAVGDAFACARRGDGAVLCWGDDALGQTGSPIPEHAPGMSAPQPTPRVVAGVSGARAIGASSNHACAVSGDGRVRCWGYDWFAALGRGDDSTGQPDAVPALVSGLEDATSIAIDGTTSCALRVDGSVWCWGGITSSFPGFDPATADRCAVVVDQTCWRSARPLAGIAGRVLRLGGGVGCVHGAEGWQCWGRDDWGQRTGESGGLEASDVASGNGHFCILDRASMSCRGRGDEGQLGDGRRTSTRALVPITLE